MIYSMLGSRIKAITEYESDTGAVGFIRESDGEFRRANIHQLKADGGLSEIIAAIERICKPADKGTQ